VYALLSALGAGLLVAAGFFFLPEEPYYVTGSIAAVIALAGTFYLTARMFARKVTPAFQAAHTQAQSGKLKQAIKTLEDARAFDKWVPGLDQQINGQIGAIHFAAGEMREANEYLGSAGVRNPQAFAMRAAIQLRQKAPTEAQETLENGVRHNRKSALLGNFLAYVLNAQGKLDDAIAVLEASESRLPSDEATTENLQRLRNKQRMAMGAFGDLWYSLGIETLPGTARTLARPGFRQPPKNKGRRRQR
jgi:predicted Zn-dependent protease